MVATGKLTTYRAALVFSRPCRPPPPGEGAPTALLEDRRRKLQAEGLFDPARKKPIPNPPRVLGVVTSRRAAR